MRAFSNSTNLIKSFQLNFGAESLCRNYIETKTQNNKKLHANSYHISDSSPIIFSNKGVMAASQAANSLPSLVENRSAL